MRFFNSRRALRAFASTSLRTAAKRRRNSPSQLLSRAVNTTLEQMEGRVMLSSTPLAPTNAFAVLGSAAGPVGYHQNVNVAWTIKSSVADGYVVERATNIDFTQNVTDSALLPANTATYNDNTVNASTTYFYRVAAKNGNAASTWATAPSSVAVPAGTAAAPSYLHAVAGNAKLVHLSWLDNSFNHERGFRLQRADDVGFAHNVVTFPATGPDVAAIVDNTVESGKTYSYRAAAINDYGDSAWSNIDTVTVPVSAPAAPSGIKAMAGGTDVANIGWSDNSIPWVDNTLDPSDNSQDNEDFYAVERSTDGGPFTSFNTTDPNVTTVNGVTTTARDVMLTTGAIRDTSVESGHSYIYRAKAVRGTEQSAWTTTTTAAVIPQPTLVAPTGLKGAGASPGLNNLVWSPTVNPKEGYSIQRATNSGFTANVTTPLDLGDVTTYADTTNLTAGVAYYYRVRARNGGVVSNWSAISNAVTDLASQSTSIPTNPPLVPSNFAAVASGNNTINVIWTVRDLSGKIFLERSSDGGTTWSAIGDPNGLPTSQALYPDSGLASNTLYKYRARQINNGHASGYTNIPTPTTLPLAPVAPTNVTVVGAGPTTFNIFWTNQSSTGDKIFKYTPTGYVQIGTVGAGVTSYMATGFPVHAGQYFRVVATVSTDTGDLDSSPSLSGWGETTLNTPATPINLTAVAANPNAMNLSWTDTANNEKQVVLTQVGYDPVYLPAGTTSYSVFNLPSYTQQIFHVQNLGDTANSSISVSGSTSTPNGTPATPTGFKAVAANSSDINLMWTDNANDEGGYLLTEYVNGAWTPIATVPADTNHLTVNGLGPNTTHTFRVAAISAYNDVLATSGASAATTLPLALDSLTAADDSDATNSVTANDSSVPDLYVGEDANGTATIDLGETLNSTSSQGVENVLWTVTGASGASPASGDFVSSPGSPNPTVIFTPTEGEQDYTITAWIDANSNGHIDAGETYRTIDIHPVKVRIILPGLADGDEPSPNNLDPGVFLPLNNDDDNNNGVADRFDSGTVVGEDDLVPMQIQLSPGVTSGAVSLALVSGADKVNVWASADKAGGAPLLDASNSTLTWNVGQDVIPQTVYVEAIDTSLSFADITFNLAFTAPTTTSQPTTHPTTQDSANATVGAIDMDVTDNGTLGDQGDGIGNYLPGYNGTTQALRPNHAQHVNVIVSNLKPGQVVDVYLSDTSGYAGIASNANSDSNVFPSTDQDDDFVLDHDTATAGADGKAVIGLVCRDFGGHTTMTVNDQANNLIARMKIPLDTDGDGLPDIWEDAYNGNLPQGAVGFDKTQKQTINGTNDEDRDDDHNTGANPPNDKLGDGFSAFDEYRGFMVMDPTNLANNIHVRTTPTQKNVFVYSPDKDPYLAANDNEDGFQDNPANGVPIGIPATARQAPVIINQINDQQFDNSGDEPTGNPPFSPKGDVNFNSTHLVNNRKQKRVWITTDLTKRDLGKYGKSGGIEGQVGPNSVVGGLPINGVVRAAGWVLLTKIRSTLAFVDGDGVVSAGPGKSPYIFARKPDGFTFIEPANFPPIDKKYTAKISPTQNSAVCPFQPNDHVVWADLDGSAGWSKGDALWYTPNNNVEFDPQQDNVIVGPINENNGAIVPIPARTGGFLLDSNYDFRYVRDIDNPGYNLGAAIFTTHFDRNGYLAARDMIIAHEGLGHPIGMNDAPANDVNRDADIMVNEFQFTAGGLYDDSNPTGPRYVNFPSDFSQANKDRIQLL